MICVAPLNSLDGKLELVYASTSFIVLHTGHTLVDKDAVKLEVDEFLIVIDGLKNIDSCLILLVLLSSREKSERP